MTFPGADTMKDGIMGVDCFRRKGILCGVSVSSGEKSGVWVPCDAVDAERGERVAEEMLSLSMLSLSVESACK